MFCFYVQCFFTISQICSVWRESGVTHHECIVCRQDLRAVREGRVVSVDGSQHFNRPGPRLVDALEWLTGLINDRTDIIPPAFPWKWLKTP
jgi:hypothetical protein